MESNTFNCMLCDKVINIRRGFCSQSCFNEYYLLHPIHKEQKRDVLTHDEKIMLSKMLTILQQTLDSIDILTEKRIDIETYEGMETFTDYVQFAINEVRDEYVKNDNRR